jgi:hypothetical protein
LFETQLEGSEAPVVFGSSGLLYRSNKLMFDRKTKSLWNQFSGEPVVGPLVGSSIKLKVRPMTITTWKSWRQLQPHTTVLSLQTGHVRNYDSGVVYRDYFASPDLMFPAVVQDERQLLRKDYVFAIRGVAASRAWPLSVFEDKPVLNDQVGSQAVVLLGDSRSRTVRAYERYGHERFQQLREGAISTQSQTWERTENFLVSADGKEKRARLPGHIAYWFAWENFMGERGTVYQP